MRITFVIASGCIGLAIAYAYPLVAILRGRNIGVTVLKAWAALLVYVVVLCGVLPLAVTYFNHELGREMFMRWVPERTAVGGALVLGWLPPSMAGLFALAMRWLLGAYWPNGLA